MEGEAPIEQFGIFVPLKTNLLMALKQQQIQRNRVELEFSKKLHDLTVEFEKANSEFFTKRKAMIVGEYIPSDAECTYEFQDPDDTDAIPNPHVGVPDFWRHAFRNSEVLNTIIQSQDEPALKHLVDVTYELLTEPTRGFKINFHFSPNEFFTNEVLSKTFLYAEGIDKVSPLTCDNLFVDTLVGCTIDWKSDAVNLTQAKVVKKMKNKNDSQIKSVEKYTTTDSFFNYFDTPEETYTSADEDSRELLASEIEIGEELRHSIIPKAVLYYTGEIGEFEDDFDEEDFDEFDEDDLDESEGEDDEEDEDEGKAGSGKKSSPSKSGKSRGNARALHGAGKGPKGENPPECKQQ